MLSRHKKKGYDGFKYFVGFLETLSSEKRREIVEDAILEDPVYMIWILKNMINMNYLSSMDSKSIESFFTNCPNVLEAIAKSIISHPLKDTIITHFVPASLKKELLDLMEIFKNIPKGSQDAAQFFILERVRSLQSKGIIEEFNWKLPGPDIAFEPHNKIQNGQFELRYENGTIALSGQITLTKREGAWLHNYSNGQLMAEGGYKKGLRDGVWTFYTTDGTLKSKGKFQEDRKNGIWQEKNYQGNMIEVSYNKGKVAKD